MGASSGLATATSDAMLTTLIQAIQHLIGNQSFILCGHSYGGYLALGLANQLSNLVQGLFLTCPVITANAQKRLTASPLNIIQEKVSPTTHSEFYDDYLNMTVNINQESWHAYQQQVIPAIQAANKPFLDQLTGNHFQNYQLAFENSLKNAHYQMPLTMLVGHHDSVVGYQEQLQVATQSPQGELILLNHAGHNLPFDQPKAVAFHFRRFLSELA
ncbi:hypothetical protein YK48G_06580 [Lentilactobacillus fungorum]|uniref:Serine aminopeptidase S33 domain-containing protein n=1 Tax=Lentilactobacillus fungorum TaxID=2201250 RepID=A0ABQ3VWF7_9LACO|nr:alpha/beta hydrolase [Lentilactobacillus fungorum]GHP13233.1 hypothetical protein YK48G_06580 [Lentilactobacillus fungorum]